MQFELSTTIASNFAQIAIRNVLREYPNAPQHIMTGPKDFGTPRCWHPIFYGCFDWHSAVHAHWLMARLCRIVDDLPEQKQIEAHFDAVFTEKNVAKEIAYFQLPQAIYFERPYGWAWLLELSAELKQHPSPAWNRRYQMVQPLVQLIVSRWKYYLSIANYPTRTGTHTNSAFALILSHNYAQIENKTDLLELLKHKAMQWYGNDTNCQPWEPSQEDFLSPVLCEAFCMQRLFPADEFSHWFNHFLPDLSNQMPATLFTPATVANRADGRIGHLDGLNFSRAWCLRGIADAVRDPEIQTMLRRSASEHFQTSFPHISTHYAGEHWLATFALLAMS